MGFRDLPERALLGSAGGACTHTHTQSTTRINVDAAFMRVVEHLSDMVLM